MSRGGAKRVWGRLLNTRGTSPGEMGEGGKKGKRWGKARIEKKKRGHEEISGSEKEGRVPESEDLGGRSRALRHTWGG